MFKTTLLIDSYELEKIAQELGYEYDMYYPLVQELDVTIEDGVCIREYKKTELKNYEKYYSKLSIKILEGFFEKHKVNEFVIVAAY